MTEIAWAIVGAGLVLAWTVRMAIDRAADKISHKLGLLFEETAKLRAEVYQASTGMSYIRMTIEDVANAVWRGERPERQPFSPEEIFGGIYRNPPDAPAGE